MYYSIEVIIMSMTEKIRILLVKRKLSAADLAKLLKYNTEDALSKANLTSDEKVLLLNNNIRLVPKLPVPEEKGSYVIVLMDSFVTNQTNPQFRDNAIIFDIICHTDNWIMDDYMLRPFKIMHEIDNMFNNKKLNGIGKTQFVSATSLVLSAELAGFTMSYKVVNDI
jgi:hypothetical protein